MVDIEANLKAYLGRREPRARYTSFDYCFNYFQSHREQGKLPDLLRGEALQLSCLHLGSSSRTLEGTWSRVSAAPPQ